MLAQHEGDTGSLSSLMGTFSTVMGTIGIILVSLGIWGRVEIVGTLTAVLGVLSAIMWLCHKFLRTRGLDYRSTER